MMEPRHLGRYFAVLKTGVMMETLAESCCSHDGVMFFESRVMFLESRVMFFAVRGEPKTRRS